MLHLKSNVACIEYCVVLGKDKNLALKQIPKDLFIGGLDSSNSAEVHKQQSDQKVSANYASVCYLPTM
jgi:hypothetical protein